MSGQVTLFDLDSTMTPKRAWSINPWKTRLILNFKGLPYKTEFLNFPDIGPTFEKLGVPKADEARYTVPAVRMPDGKYIMDNTSITPALEELKPSPSLHLGNPMYEKVKAATDGGLVGSLMAEVLPRILTKLDPPATEYFAEAARTRFGVNDPQEFQREKGGDKAWAAAADSAATLAQLLKENPSGPYFLGKEPSYSDIWLMAAMEMLKVLDKKELFDRVIAFDPVFTTWYKACEPWAAKAD